MLYSGSFSGLRPGIALGVAAALASLACGCGGTDASPQRTAVKESASDDLGEGGGGIPKLGAGVEMAGDSIAFQGVAEVVVDGCIRVRLTAPSGESAARWAVWPPTSELYSPNTSNLSSARIGDELFSDRDRVSGAGQLVTLAALPYGDRPGSFFASKEQYCDAQEGGVLVIHEVKHEQ